MIPSGARVWIAMGHTDMRRGMQSLAAMVQQHFMKDPFAGDLWVFRGRSGTLVKIIWHDGIGMSLYAKRIEKGRFIWPSAKDGVVSLAATTRTVAPATGLPAGSTTIPRTDPSFRESDFAPAFRWWRQRLWRRRMQASRTIRNSRAS